MKRLLQRIGRDFRDRRHLDAYILTALSACFALLSVFGDVIPENLRWGVLLAGISVLVGRITLPEHVEGSADQLFNDRTAFEQVPLSQRLKRAREVWIFAPSAVNILSTHNCEALRRTVLSRPDGSLRVVILDPDSTDAVDLAARQLDESLDFPVQPLKPSLEAALHQLRSMAGWQTVGAVDFKLLGYSPGFSLVAINPNAREGLVIVEFHGYHNEATGSRMHIELQRTDSERWFAYWTSQFDHIWQDARAAS